MKISDDERREVAAKLRESREFISCLPKTTPEQNALDTFELILACAGYEKGNLFDHLADLIDRPTARIDVNKHGRAYCTNCGCDDWCLADGSHFCPNCGAGMVE